MPHATDDAEPQAVASAGSLPTVPGSHPEAGIGRGTRRRLVLAGAGALLALAVLMAVSHYAYDALRAHYLLLHTVAEMFAVVIAVGIFVVVWYSRRVIEGGYLPVLGVAYLCVGVLDLLHTLAYKNMGVFDASYGTNLATQLWVVARQTEATSLLLAVLLVRVRLSTRLLLPVYAVATAVLLASIFAWDVYPTCYVEGQGLTAYKRISEYVICGVLVVSAGLLYLRRWHFDVEVLAFLVASTLVTVASELAFTLYADPYGPWNFWGHALKVVSFYFILRALVLTAVVRPQAVLFRELKRRGDALRRANTRLETRIAERTSRLASTVKRLRTEVREHLDTREQLELERGRLFAVLRMLPSYVCLRDAQHRIRFANEKFLELFGGPHRGRCYSILKGRDQPCQGCPVDRVLADDVDQEWEWTDPNGRSFHAWAYPFTEADGTVLGLELGVDITERRRLEAEVLKVSETERRRIGEDLHDSLGQVLSGAACLSGALRRRLQAAEDREAEQAAKIESLLNQSIDLTRALARGLDPVGLEPEGLMHAMADLAANVADLFGVTCEFRCDEPVLVEDTAVARHLYRIAQEATSNAARHGKAGRITISLEADGNPVALRIEDDGVGLPAEPQPGGTGLGLRVMQYRAHAIGADFEIGPRPGGGTAVVCRMHQWRKE